MLETGIVPQATVILPGAVITGRAAGSTVMILLPVIVRLQGSVNDHVSTSVPPQLFAVPVRTATTVPEIKQLPETELE